MAGKTAGFESTEQAAELIRLVFDGVLPEYKKFHRDLLGHQDEEALYRPFFIAKACQATLGQEGPWSETSRVVRGALDRLNDFIGHRPVAVLQAQKDRAISPRVGVPDSALSRGGGVAVGRYHDLISATIDVLRATDRTILDKAYFDPDHLPQSCRSIHGLTISIIPPTSGPTITSASGIRTRSTTRATIRGSSCKP